MNISDGGFPDEIRGGAITQAIFDAYHNELYPLITKYREEYVLPTASSLGYLHLGLGCRIYTDDAAGDIRTLHNATCQFWSILTLIAINELNYQVASHNRVEDVMPHGTIYDSIYVYVKEDAETVKWLNDTLVPIMNTEYIEGITVPNKCVGELSNCWTDMVKINNGASIEEVQKIIDEIKLRKQHKT